MKKRQPTQPKRRNPAARALSAPLYRSRTVRSRKAYTRKRQNRTETDDPRSARPPGLQAARGKAAPRSGPQGCRMERDR